MSRLLVLVPTDLERRPLTGPLAGPLAAALGDAGRIELCGFGLVAAAARTAGLLARHSPERVLLVGLAGRLDERLPIGSAHRFTSVACFGVGAGSGDGFETAGALGWPHWPGEPGDSAVAIGDRIECDARLASDLPASGLTASDIPGAGLLVTACAASASPAEAALRRKAFPSGVAEDMEGFGVALACRLAGVPLDIVRGISNTAGDRDKGRWQIGPALAAAADLAARLLTATPLPPSRA
jgi:futalosine hydrolase